MILDDFNVEEEEAHIFSKGSVMDFYNQILYYMKLDIYDSQIYQKHLEKLTKEIKLLKTLNNKLSQTIIQLNHEK